LLYAAVASNTTVSDPHCGRKLGNASWIVSVVGIVISVLVIIITVSVVVSAANQAVSQASQATSQATRCSSYYPYSAGGDCYRYRRYYGSSNFYYCSGYKSGGYCYYD